MLLLLLACADKSPVDSGPAPLQDAYILSDDGLYPEGFAFHAGERAFFMGSLGAGSMTRLDADGAETLIFEPEPGWLTLGMKINPLTDELVVCAIYGYGTEESDSALWRFDPATGERTATVPLSPAFAQPNCNDLAFDAAGATYVTDRESPNIYRVTPEDEVSLFATDPALGSNLIGLNGAVVTEDGDLLVGLYSPATVLRIPTSDPTDIHEVEVGGDPLGSLPDGLDGMILVDGVLVIAGNSQVLELVSEDGWETATATAKPQAVNFAAVTEAEGRVYGLKGEIVPFVLGTETELPFEVRGVE